MQRRCFVLTHLVVAIGLLSCRDRSDPKKNEPPPSRMKAMIEQPAEKAAPDWASAIKHAVRFDAAKSAVVVDVEIAPGFHAYTIGEETGRPLKIELAPDSELKASGEVVYPAGITKNLPLGKSVIVEGKTEVVAPVKTEAGKKAKGNFHYQVCTDEACDRPRSAPFEVTASVQAS